MTARGTRLARVGVAAVSTLLALAAGELLARWMDAGGPPIVRPEQFSDVLADRHDLRFEELFVADADRFWRLAPSTTVPRDAGHLSGVVANRAGLREDHEIPRRKPDGQTRILFVGDSTTFGYGVDLGETFVERTEALLRTRHPGRDVECINAGVPGYTLFQGWRFLETDGWAYDPDLVVLGFGWNGAESWDGAGDLETYERRARATPPPPLDRLRLARLLWRAAAPDEPQVNVTFRPRLFPYEFRELLDRIGADAGRRDRGVLTLVLPGRSNLAWTPTRDHRTPLQAEQRAFGQRAALGAGEASLDLVPAFQRLADTLAADELLFDSVHPTALGHRAVAEALVARLEPWLREEAGR